MKILFTFVIILCLGTKNLAAQVVNFYDANFRSCLVNNSAINTNGDGAIQISEAIAYNGTISCSYQNISDLGGIEAFVNLTGLDCVSNQLTSLDLSQNTNLTSLNCFLNNLGSLDVSQNTSLTYLDCSSNNIASLDVRQNVSLTNLRCSSNRLASLDISQNTNLIDLDCSSNYLTNLNVTPNTSLTSLSCTSNQMTSLDVSQNTSLTRLNCSSNQLTNLDVSQNISLTNLSCNRNQLISLDVSQNTGLTNLRCYSNQLTNLDVRQNVNLTDLRCHSNQLINLNAKNGSNNNFAYFYAYNNPTLTCIEVDDSTYSATNWTTIDSIASFSTDCSLFISIPILNTLECVKVYPNPTRADVTLDFGKVYQEVTIQVQNVIGEIIVNQQLKNNSTTRLKLSGAAGIYFITIQAETETKTLQIIKE